MLADNASLAMPNPEARSLRSAMAELLPTLRARAITLCRSRVDADDLLQETVLRALRFETTFRPGTNLRAWMNQVMQSVFISRCRSGERERRALQRFHGDPTLTAPSSPAPVLRTVSASMHAALQDLPPNFLCVVLLVDLHEHSYREAAGLLGIPVGTVMSRLFRARRLLETALAGTAPVQTAMPIPPPCETTTDTTVASRTHSTVTVTARAASTNSVRGQSVARAA